MDRELISKTAKCKRCNSTTVAWHQSSKGNWYLIEVFKDEHDFTVANYRDFHSTYCGKPELHADAQTEIDRAAEDRRRIREEGIAARQEATEQAEQALRDKIISMVSSQRLIFLHAEHAKLTKIQENWVSMDTMVEHMRWVAECNTQKRLVEFIADVIETEPPKA